MIKKLLAVVLTTAAVIGLTSCGKDPVVKNSDDDYTLSLNGADNLATKVNLGVNLNYNGTAGISSLQTTFTVGDKTYSKNDLLPTWVAIGEKLNIQFTDKADYTKKNNADIYTSVKEGTDADLLALATDSMNEYAANGKVLALNKYFGYMPNFVNLLKKSPSLANQMRSADGNIYFTPYFDGFDSIEKMFLMNTDYVKALLDESPVYYTDAKTTTYRPYGSLDTETVLTASDYKAYIPSLRNEKIAVANANGVGHSEITVSIASGKDIISRMNAVSTKNGANLVAEFKAYIDAVYGEYIGAGKTFAQRSDIFTSAQAVYNADELVALLRCVKTNPKYLANKTNINPFFTRSGEANRQHSAQSLAQIWGVRGTDSEKDKLYFDAKGNLVDGRTQNDLYNALDNVNKLYKEGLIVTEFYKGYGNSAKGLWSENLLKTGEGFMSYDYNATQTVYTESYKGSTFAATKSYMPVLPPVAKWNDGGKNIDGTENPYDYFHFSEDSRQLKSGGWCVPVSAARTQDQLKRALTLMDSMFDRGVSGGKGIADIQDFGPDNEYYRNGTMTLKDGQVVVNIADSLWTRMAATGKGWNDYYRFYVGSTNTVGHVRSDGLDYQATSLPGRYGISNIQLATGAGTMAIAKSAAKNSFYLSVPTTWGLDADTLAAIAANEKVTKLSNFWRESGTDISTFSLVICEGFGSSQNIPTIKEIQGYFKESNNLYLASYADYYTANIYKEVGTN